MEARWLVNIEATVYDRSTQSFGVGGKVSFGGQEFVTSETVRIDEDQSVDIYARADHGYDFIGWAYKNAPDNVIAASNVLGLTATANTRLCAVFDEHVHTLQHYTDETSRRTETEITSATATNAGTKEICVYCAGGCGEVVERYTETIPVTGEPDTPDEPTDPTDPDSPSGNNICKWDDVDHGTSFWGRPVKFFHSILYFFAHLFGRR